MKARKFISTLLATAMVASAFVATASAAVTWEYDGEYYNISSAKDAATRTPYIETTVTKLTGDEVVALKSEGTSFSSKKLSTSAGKYGDTATYSVYKVTATYKNIGALIKGYDAANTDIESWVRLQSLDGSLDLTGLTAIEDISIAAKPDSLSGVTWVGGRQGDSFGVTLTIGPANALPKEDGIIEAPETSFTYYVVTAADAAAFEIPFSTAAAKVGFSIKTKDDNAGEFYEVKVASRSAAAKIGATTPVVKDIAIDASAEATTATGYVWNVALTNAAKINEFKATFKADGAKDAVKYIRNIADVASAISGEGSLNFQVGVLTDTTTKTNATATFDVKDSDGKAATTGAVAAK